MPQLKKKKKPLGLAQSGRWRERPGFPFLDLAMASQTRRIVVQGRGGGRKGFFLLRNTGESVGWRNF